MPDFNTLTLFCDGKLVGVCKFDLGCYIGINTPVLETAHIKPANYELKDEYERVLRGDVDQFPGAFIEFKITCKREDGAYLAPR